VIERRTVVDLPFTADGVRRARLVVRECAAGLAPDLVDNAELLVSEIVTNAVRHGAPNLRLMVVVQDGGLSIQVADGSSRLPVARARSAAHASSGRGLEIVELLAASWGAEVDPATGGKTVWFRVTDFAQPEAGRVVGSGREKGTTWN
jgi:anti-sigma regulatory factor (Ser/Thr protein kinase)